MAATGDEDEWLEHPTQAELLLQEALYC